MHQITRCPFCGTCFKVSHDQLSLSDGWVRCGKCTEVFDARQHFQQASASAAPSGLAAPAEGLPPADGAESIEAPSPLAAPAAENNEDFDDFLRITDKWQHDLSTTFQASNAVQPEAPSSLEGPDSAHLDARAWPLDTDTDTDTQAPNHTGGPLTPTDHEHDTHGIDPAFLEELFEASQSQRAGLPEPSEDESPLPAAIPEAAQTTEIQGHDADEVDAQAPLQSDINPHDLQFVRHANKRQFWRKKSVRLLLSTLALGLLVVLATQLAIWQRQTVAAINPTTKAWMQTLCSHLGCSIAPRASLDELSIDSSSFQVISPQNYALSWTLLNNSQLWTKTPALELVLLDAKENMVLTRVLTPQELGLAPELAPQLRVQTTQGLQIDAKLPEITGYRLRIFYPD